MIMDAPLGLCKIIDREGVLSTVYGKISRTMESLTAITKSLYALREFDLYTEMIQKTGIQCIGNRENRLTQRLRIDVN